MLEVILFFFIVVAGTGGELCVSSAMKSIGEVHDFRPRSLLNFVLQSLRLPWMWMGIVLMARDAVPLAELAHGVLARVVLHYKAKLFFHNTARFPCHALCSTSTCHSLSVSGMRPVCFVRDAPGPYRTWGSPLPWFHRFCFKRRWRRAALIHPSKIWNPIEPKLARRPNVSSTIASRQSQITGYASSVSRHHVFISSHCYSVPLPGETLSLALSSYGGEIPNYSPGVGVYSGSQGLSCKP